MAPTPRPSPAFRRAAFHRLRVAAIDPLTNDAVAITFEVPGELADAYDFTQGQHVAIRVAEIGDDLRRSFSICSPAGSGVLRVAVKRLPAGRLSSYLHDHLQPGDRLEVMTPTGRFFTPLDPANEKSYVAVAAGSGITPIISIAATTLEVEPESRFTLIYGNRAANTVMFLDELADLKDRHLDRLMLHHTFSREPSEIDLHDGRIGADKLTDFVQRGLIPDEVDDWFLCGPAAMLEDLRTVLLDLGAHPASIHRELFYAGPSAITPGGLADAGDPSARVTIVLDGRASSFHMPMAGISILDAAANVRSEVPYACKGGVCGTCRARVIEGEVTLDRSYALDDHELADRYILTCQARPLTETVHIDFDV